MAVDRNRVAILVNEVGGKEKYSEITGIGKQRLRATLENKQLSGSDGIKIEGSEIKALDYIGGVFNDEALISLDFWEQCIHNDALTVKIRNAVADGLISIERLTEDKMFFFDIAGNASGAVMHKVIDWINAGNDGDIPLEHWSNDGFAIRDIDNSEFWEWYREIFYPDGE
jgi:hypothetical protein